MLKLLLTEYTTVCATESKFCRHCFVEQVTARVVRTATAAPAAAEAWLEDKDIDIRPEDLHAWDLASGLLKTWSAAAGRQHNLALLKALRTKIAAWKVAKEEAKKATPDKNIPRTGSPTNGA